MSNAVFPTLPGLQWNVLKQPTFSTAINTSVGGQEVRTQFYTEPIWVWTLTYEFLRQATINGTAWNEYESLVGFYLQRYGAYDSFLYSDPSDYTVTAQSIGTGDGTTVAFQLVRTLGGFTEQVRDVHSAPVIKVNGVTKTAGVDYTLSGSGLVTFSAAPAAAATITYTGTYYWRVRFTDDLAQFEEFANQFWLLNSLKFQSVK